MNTIKKEEVLVNNSNQPHKTVINELEIKSQAVELRKHLDSIEEHLCESFDNVESIKSMVPEYGKLMLLELNNVGFHFSELKKMNDRIIKN